MRIAAALVALASLARAAEGDAACLACHGDRAALEKARTDPARPIERLLVDAERFAGSVHAARGCAECHADFERHPHGRDAETIACAECHEAEQKALAASVHGRAREGGAGPAASCAACHGLHDIVKPTDRRSPLHPLNVVRTCGKCHFEGDAERATPEQLLEERYTDDTHARGLLLGGLTVSATCVACHGGHDVRARGDPASQVGRERVADTCGRCHVGVVETYKASVHYAKLRETGGKGATCTDCHAPHDIHGPDDQFRLASVLSCGRCHEERVGTYRNTYHGKVSHLGYGGEVATCASCHGSHDILPESDPGSRVHMGRRVETCGRCHRGAHEEFARYQVHADPSDGERYPEVRLVYVVMNGLLAGVLLLGGLHALLWLVRATAAGDWKRARHAGDGRYVRRWPGPYVAYHMVLMTSVLVLAMTGLPLHFAEKPWATAVMRAAGGPAVAGFVHRAAALTMIALFAVYLAHLFWRAAVRREKGLFTGPSTMLPRWKDFRDLAGNVRWFLFLAPRPRYDRWTYWEKFDFWAVFWGLFVIGFSGLVLWFPVQATRLFPGWFVNVAMVVHGIEALLDIAFIFTVHVFHANLRPDKFPMDTTYLTGRLPLEEFARERPLEYERAVREGTLETLLAPAPARGTRITAFAIGGLALLVGFFFVGAMIVAVLEKLG